ncbi:hypothetical protein [Candidatus Desulfovibrio trichonymphae]|nr:hypothetical protein [Candidatus Desulfovibrio trichonymphae]
MPRADTPAQRRSSASSPTGMLRPARSLARRSCCRRIPGKRVFS